MARISSYPNEKPVEDNDAWIGTAFPGGQTRQFRAEDVAKYLNIKGKISISAQMVFRFTSTMASGSITGFGDNTPFSSITTMQVSNTDTFGQNVTKFIPYLVGSDLLISEQNDISLFGHYKIVSYTPAAAGNFATLTLTFIGGNGSFKLLSYYDVANFALAANSDKNFVFIQDAIKKGLFYYIRFLFINVPTWGHLKANTLYYEKSIICIVRCIYLKQLW